MAIDYKAIAGSYDQTPEDSSHQASSKFSNPVNKPKDAGEKGTKSVSVKDSDDYKIGS